MKNYNKEVFYPTNNIQDEMKKISNRLKQNFHSGDYIPVKKFSRGVRNKGNLVELIENINEKFPELRTGKEKRKRDYSGIYLFAIKKEKEFTFQYVGISQQVINRLKQHVCASDKGSATWAFLMAKVNYNLKNNFQTNLTKNNFSGNDVKNAIIKQQEEISKNHVVTYYPVDNNFLMYITEPYIACDLNCYWNSFETH